MLRHPENAGRAEAGSAFAGYGSEEAALRLVFDVPPLVAVECDMRISRFIATSGKAEAMESPRAKAMDHLVLVLFENRSFDNLLGHLYQPGEVETFEGVLGRDLSNPIPAWAEHGTELGPVAYGIAADMDSPNPDPGEEYQHTNTQLFNVLDPSNRFKDATE